MKKSYFIIISVLLIIILGLAIYINIGKPENSPPVMQETPVPTATYQPTHNPTPTLTPTPTPVPEIKISLVSCGDIMYHGPQLRSAFNEETGEYNFMNNFKYIREIVSKADYAVANLETTLAGSDNGYKYSGHPAFNSPDAVLDSIKDAGFDMLLLSNNHIYDTRRVGMERTLMKTMEYGFDTLELEGEGLQSYYVKEINGVKIGFLNYGYESADYRKDDGKYINGIFAKNEDARLIDTFNYSMKDEFYNEVEERVAQLKLDGADLIILYIHWGNEYQLKENSHQREIARKICELGVDVIFGSHPHVIQPSEIITDENTGKRTICFYSLGNFISNQNRVTLKDPSVPLSEYTENGVLVWLDITKLPSGETFVSKIELVPTWVHRFFKEGRTRYE
ncbi:MAG: CapA family protein, partial [Clostridiaceae bacterium]|nr:CapA family protein [Clostridiaceae bacterium]